ncbi:hypothetical protein [Algoriphagus algorifonticola]|uniref:hypothetical protein n=1 Tax=Algoriphagus algorifonticola TaxID=2593007 RepID=UPI00119CDAEF|nr:hypothetical protein [Algoriphagus algorifonticola]
MTRLAPDTRLILEYSSFFKEEPKSRIQFLEGLPKEAILYELAYLNYLLKAKNRVQFDDSFETQISILGHLFKSDFRYDYYLRIILSHIQGKATPSIFLRGTFLFAMEEITQSQEISFIEGIKLENISQWERLFKYLLAVNSELIKIGEKSKGFEKTPTFENLNPALIPINELAIESNPVFTNYRGFLLAEYLLSVEKYSQKLNQYFESNFGCSPKAFVQKIQGVIMHESFEDKKFGFCYRSNGGDPFLDSLSKRTKNKELFKFIGIRKSPLIKVNENDYLLADSIFLIEKCYSQFINDFWFDLLRGECKNREEQDKAIEELGGHFGRFFEQYCCGILERIFSGYKYSIFLTLNQLRVSDPKGDSEFSDFYLRYQNKVIVGQIKGGGINDKSKYGGDIDELYHLGRDEFFRRFGVDQIAKSVSTLVEMAPIFDRDFPIGKQLHVFPILVVNEKVFQTALFADVFNDRFKELTSGLNFGKLTIKRLVLTHISDWENSEAYLSESPKRIWEIFESHYRDKKFVPAFSNTLNKLIPQKKRIPKDFAKRLFEVLTK